MYTPGVRRITCAGSPADHMGLMPLIVSCRTAPNASAVCVPLGMLCAAVAYTRQLGMRRFGVVTPTTMPSAGLLSSNSSRLTRAPFGSSAGDRCLDTGTLLRNVLSAPSGCTEQVYV